MNSIQYMNNNFTRDELKVIIKELMVRNQFGDEELVDEDLTVEKNGLTFIDQSKVDEKLKVPQATVSRAFRDMEEEGILFTRGNRPKLRAIKPEAISEVDSEEAVRINEKINDSIKELLREGYPNQELSTDRKRELLEESDDLLIPESDMREYPLSDIEIVWGSFIESLSLLSDSSRPEDWMRFMVPELVTLDIENKLRPEPKIDVSKLIAENQRLELSEEDYEEE